MKLYYHHVGVEGSTTDFPKTVFSELPLSIVEDSIPTHIVQREEILRELAASFPTGHFNCWGVPSGARSVIKNLSPGDVVLLIATTSKNGEIPALCEVKGFWSIHLPELSNALWGSHHYPYIFFFSTEEITLTWGEFSKHLNYAPKYDPRGSFLSVDNKRLSNYGGAEEYVEFLRKRFAVKPKVIYSITAEKTLKDKLDKGDVYQVQTSKEIDNLVEETLKKKPALTSGRGKVTRQSKSSPRDEAFRRGVRSIYGSRCAICNQSLLDPDGRPEVQSAHIYPKELDGKDDLRNGICLCRMHHWAFDSGWMALADDLTILVSENLPEGREYDFIRMYADRQIAQPIREELRPHPLYLYEHRKLHGFE